MTSVDSVRAPAKPSTILRGNVVAQGLLLVGLYAVPLMADLLAEAPYYGLQAQLYPWTVVGAVVVALFLLLLLGVEFHPAFLNRLGSGNARRVMMMVCLFPAMATFPFMGGTPSVPVRLFFILLSVIFLLLLARNPSTLFWFFMLALVYSFVQRYRFFTTVPLQSEFSDIMPLIALGGKNFLSGHAPYVTYNVPPVLPLVYLPVTWLSYVPALAAGLDMRVTNLVAELGIVLVFLSLVYPARHRTAVNFAFGYAAFLIVLPTSMFWDAFTAHPIWWFWLLLALRLLIARKFVRWAIAMGVTAATSQLALVVLPLFGLYVLREKGVRALLYFVILGGTALMIVAPFAYRNPFGFVNDTVFYFSDLKNYGALLWKQSQRWQYILGFGGEAWRRGFPDALRYVQGAGVLILAGIYALFYTNSSANLVRLMTVTLGLFLLFSAVVWHYYYQVVFYLLLFYVALVTVSANTENQIGVTT